MKATKLAVLIGAAVLFVTPSEASIKDDVKAFFANVTENVKNTIRSVQRKIRSTIVEKHTDSVEKARVAVDGKKGLEKISEKLATIKTGDAFAADLDAKLDDLDKKVADRLAQIAEEQKEGSFKELLQGIADMLGQKVTPELTEEVTMLANDVTMASDSSLVDFSLSQTKFSIPIGDGSIDITIDNDGVVIVTGDFDGVVVTGRASIFYGDELARITVKLDDKVPGVPMSFDIYVNIDKDGALVYGLKDATIKLENAGLEIKAYALVTDDGEPGAQTGEAGITLAKDEDNFVTVFTVIDKGEKEYGVGIEGGVELGEYGNLAAGVEFDMIEGGKLDGIGLLVDEFSLGAADKTLIRASNGLLQFVSKLSGEKGMEVSTRDSHLTIDVLPKSYGSDSLLHLVSDGGSSAANVQGYMYLIGRSTGIRLTRYKAQVKGMFGVPAGKTDPTFVGKVLIPSHVAHSDESVAELNKTLKRLKLQEIDVQNWTESSGSATATGWKSSDGDYLMADIFYGDIEKVTKPEATAKPWKDKLTIPVPAVAKDPKNPKDEKLYYIYDFDKSTTEYIIVSGGSYKTEEKSPLTQDKEITAIFRPGFGKCWDDGTTDQVEIKWKAKAPEQIDLPSVEVVPSVVTREGVDYYVYDLFGDKFAN